MIYKVYTPSFDDVRGNFVGYICLCHAKNALAHIYNAMIAHNIISKSWFLPSELRLNIEGSRTIYGMNDYYVKRRILLTTLFYMCPLEPQNYCISSKYSNNVLDNFIADSTYQSLNRLYADPIPLPRTPVPEERPAPIQDENILIGIQNTINRLRRNF